MADPNVVLAHRGQTVFSLYSGKEELPTFVVYLEKHFDSQEEAEQSVVGLPIKQWDADRRNNATV